MVETVAPDGSDESLDVAVGLRRQHGRPHNARACALGDGVEVAPELGVMVAQEELRTAPEWRQLPKLLRQPGARGLASSHCTQDPTRLEVHDDEDKVAAEPEV